MKLTFKLTAAAVIVAGSFVLSQPTPVLASDCGDICVSESSCFNADILDQLCMNHPDCTEVLPVCDNRGSCAFGQEQVDCKGSPT